MIRKSTKNDESRKNMRENLEKNMTRKFAETDAGFLKIVWKPLRESDKIFSSKEVL
jgi:hypothetical protein